MDLTDRQQAIVRAVVEEYVKTAEPVGSAVVAERSGIEASPATIRAEMAALEEGGFLMQPHTSAGRVPTDAGYRYYIDALIKPRSLHRRTRETLERELQQLQSRHDELARTAAQLLAGLSHALAVSGLSDRVMHRAGFAALLEDPSIRSNDKELERLSDTFRYLDQRIEELYSFIQRDVPEVYVGEENPVEELQNVSMVLSRFRLRSGEEGLIAIVGPRRMRYTRNISLVEYVQRLLNE